MKKCSSCGETKDIDEFNERLDSKDGVRGQCKVCSETQKKAYRHNNKEKVAAQKKKYRQEHKEEIAAYFYEYYRNNKEDKSAYDKEYNQKNRKRLSAQHKKYEQDNKEKLTAQRKAYAEEHKEEKAEYDKEYRQNNKEKIAAGRRAYRQTPVGKAAVIKDKHKRRARKNNAEYERFDPTEIFERDGWRCQRCRKKVRPDCKPHHPLYPNLDHIVCLANGGSHTRQNTQLLCHRCNTIKATNDSGEQLRLFGQKGGIIRKNPFNSAVVV